MMITIECMFAGLPVILPSEEESVLVGSAVLGACASKDFGSIQVCKTLWHLHSIWIELSTFKSSITYFTVWTLPAKVFLIASLIGDI
jgi:hypothetical protein